MNRALYMLMGAFAGIVLVIACGQQAASVAEKAVIAASDIVLGDNPLGAANLQDALSKLATFMGSATLRADKVDASLDSITSDVAALKQGGTIGSQGQRGDKGEKGDAGAMGPAGSAGGAGPAGPAGPTGPKGDKGDSGAAGTAGSALTGSLDGYVTLYDAVGAMQTNHSGATVQLEGTSYSATSDTTGHFRIDGVPQGSYAILIGKAGYGQSRTPNTYVTGNGVLHLVGFSLGAIPATPSSFSATMGTSTGYVQLSWQRPAATTYVWYYMYRSTLSAGPFTNVGAALPSLDCTADPCKHNDLGVSGTTYYYQLRAVQVATPSYYSADAPFDVSPPPAGVLYEPCASCNSRTNVGNASYSGLTGVVSAVAK